MKFKARLRIVCETPRRGNAEVGLDSLMLLPLLSLIETVYCLIIYSQSQLTIN